MFATRMFRWAAIYGVIVLAPLYWTPLPVAGAEIFYGFVGLALVFQGVFWTIGGDPVRYRPLMPWAVLEKLVFAMPVITFAMAGVTEDRILLAFAVVDILLGIGFFIAWRRTRATGA